MKTDFGYFLSPIGEIEIAANEAYIESIQFMSDRQNKRALYNLDNSLILTAIQQLDEFFAKNRKVFDLPLNPHIGTAFQRQVWAELSKIPFGQTKTYMGIAAKLGGSNMVRAVGAANGRNPWLIVVPCHRVNGADGALVGYAGELWRKKWLLDFESTTKQLGFDF